MDELCRNRRLVEHLLRSAADVQAQVAFTASRLANLRAASPSTCLDQSAAPLLVLQDLPDSVLLEIWRYLNVCERCTLSRVSLPCVQLHKSHG
jgi:hypothetical protein